MKTTAVITVLILCISLTSCRRKTEEPKEEKIKITVEHTGRAPDTAEKPAFRHKQGQMRGAAEIAKSDREGPDLVNTNLPSRQPPYGEPDIMELMEVRPIVQDLVATDEKVQKLIQTGEIIRLAGYLSTEHQEEMQKISRITGVKEERKLAFLISRNLIRRQQGTEGRRPLRRTPRAE